MNVHECGHEGLPMNADTLTDFLLARIADDEKVAREAYPSGPGDGEMHTSWVCDEFMHVAIGEDRMLAECEAKRRIVEAFEDERQRRDIYNRDYPLGLLTTDGDLRARLSANAWCAGLEIALRLLALPYADHPDYREEWRP